MKGDLLRISNRGNDDMVMIDYEMKNKTISNQVQTTNEDYKYMALKHAYKERPQLSKKHRTFYW